jgi:hypothetical protein
MQPKTKVLDELKQILDAGILFEAEKTKIQEREQRIKDNKPEYDNLPYQFNCDDPNQNCDFGG